VTEEISIARGDTGPEAAVVADDRGRGLHLAIVNLTAGGMSDGYTKYLQAVVPRIRADPRVARLDLFMPGGLPAPDAGPVKWWEPGRIAARRTLRRQILSLRPDIVFFPTARSVECGDVPNVVMVRNMEPLRVPFGGNTAGDALRNMARARAARRACRRATRVIAVSDHVRDFLVDRWHLPASHVGVVHHGVELPTDDCTAPALLSDGGPFILTAGSIRPARGLEDLLDAIPALRQRHPELRVAVAGRSDDRWCRYERALRQRAHHLGVERAVVWLGHLPSHELSWAYARCTAFVVTSRAEACPNVVLEAMAHGAPCVSTDQQPMPELLGNAALFYPAGSGRVLARQLCDLIASPQLAGRLAQTAAARARCFTWSRTVHRTVDALVGAARQARAGAPLPLP
jgi:glycosyltransferase involved in cell wall biosynthesis